RVLGAKEFRDEIALLVRDHNSGDKPITDEQKLLRISLHFDPYSATSIDDYEALKEQISRVNVAGILARELEKTRIDSVLAKKAIDALRAVENEKRRDILAELMKPDNLSTLAPVFTRLLIVLRDIYPELNVDTQDVIDSALERLIITDSYLTTLDLNLAYVIQVLRHRSTAEKEKLFVRLFRKAEPLVRREIILAMAEWGHTHWLRDQKRHFSGFSTWERRSFIVSSYFLGDEGSHWRQQQKISFDPCEKIVVSWFSNRFQADKSVPR
ncbi:MAG: RNA-directed polymerase, partial [Chthonomonadales bacterium]|nr:RNA-directed polymerase [Chthonomonadales bacterium]